MLPTVETYLLNTSNEGTYTITIPAGVKVVKVVVGIYSDWGNSNASLGSSGSYSSNWGSSNADSGETTTSTSYVGVTPKKTYSLTLHGGNRLGMAYTCTAKISYSASINKQTPTVTDY